MSIDRRLFADLRGLDPHELRRVLIYVGGLLAAKGHGRAMQIDGDDASRRVTYRQETVRCGKPGCKSCPHGPYWYAYYREDGKLRSRYLGRDLGDAPRS